MRSLNSFGVAGLLAQNCEIFYTNDLRVRNVGRVSDLISAKLRESSVDELRVRALMVYGIFEAYALQGIPHRHDEDVPPVSAEVGIDPAYVAVAISFHWNPDLMPHWRGLADRVDAGAGGTPFEKILEWVGRHSTQVIVRYEEMDRRIEVISLMKRLQEEHRDPTMVIAVDSGNAPLLEVSNYVEIGDLNFSKLLRTPVVEGKDTIRVAGVPAESHAESLKEIRENYEVTLSELKNTIRELQERLEAAEAEASERTFSGDGPIADDSPILVKGSEKSGDEKKDDWGLHFLKQVWPFAPKEETTVVKGGTPPVLAEEVRVFEASDEVVEPITEVVGEGGVPLSEPSLAEREAERVLKELQELAKTKTSKKVELTLQEIEAEGEPNKAKRWVDSLTAEILQEKAKLNELQKNLAKQMRQRELEFKTSERALKQELKRKDETIYQRQASIENKNEQIAQLNLAVERAASSTNDKESQQIKVKLERAQRMSQMKEEETKTLVSKVRDLENRLIIAQAKAQKGNDLQQATKVQGLEKKVEEYKRVNQRLMESLNSQKDKSSDKEIGDLRRKIDQLDRMNIEAKRNLEKSAFKFRELQESERKLQSDLARAVEENRNLRKTTTRGSGESGGQAA
jgi:hypothetical protein